jgi:hypothetical protein
MLTPSSLLGAVMGDMIGSVYEWDRIKTREQQEKYDLL